MAIRYDISIDWVSSPRLLTVAAPSTEVTVQDIVDTCRYFEDTSPGENYEYLIDAAGKEPLGGVTYVGITATFNNCQIAFEARPGPNWILCTILGGNLVAVDENGAELDPRYPTAFVSVDRTASSSATLQEQDALNYSSYQNAVWVDVNSGLTGVLYPAGTRENPVNNIVDAVLIGKEKGFSTIQLLSDVTLTNGDNIENFSLVGASSIATHVVIEEAAECNTIVIKNCDFTGVLDGNTEIQDSVIHNISYFNGYIHNCGLIGLISLDGTATAIISDCSTIDQDNPVTIDMGGGGQSLSIPNHSVIVTLRN